MVDGSDGLSMCTSDVHVALCWMPLVPFSHVIQIRPPSTSQPGITALLVVKKEAPVCQEEVWTFKAHAGFAEVEQHATQLL